MCVERFLCAIRNLESGNARPAAQVARLSCDCFVLTGSVSTAHIANNVSRREENHNFSSSFFSLLPPLLPVSAFSFAVATFRVCTFVSARMPYHHKVAEKIIPVLFYRTKQTHCGDTLGSLCITTDPPPICFRYCTVHSLLLYPATYTGVCSRCSSLAYCACL